MGRIVDLPLLYHVTGVPARARNVQSVGVLDIVPVELPEVSYADLPVALRLHGDAEGSFAAFGHGFVGSDPIVSQPIDEFADAVSGIARDRTGRYSAKDLDPQMNHVFGLGVAFTHVVAMHSRLRDDMRSIETSTEEKDRETFFRDVVPDLVLVDGALVQLEAEPCWSVRTSANYPRQMSKNAFVEFQPAFDRSGFSWRFRMDGLDRALELAAGIATSVNRSSIEVEDTGAVQWKLDEVRMATETLDRVIDDQISSDLAKMLLRNAPVDFFVAHRTLRDWHSHSNEHLLAAAGVLKEQFRDHQRYDLSIERLLIALDCHLRIGEMQAPSPELAVLDGLKI